MRKRKPYFPKNEEEIIKLILQCNGICECGALMDTDWHNEEYRCPNCGKTYFIPDYEDDGPYHDLVDGCILLDPPEDPIPGRCVACGCPAYPKCKTSCSMFDD